ncbi:hypothetical protein DY000_02010894 [Brassica cretica]|uniref:Uncharacterized protein n=1 Tax=Brassica cretica TaxID=69181 RepID=A0ABQ7DBB0_BRACR|nr:hypothetical protein DY000_02010894 [Brassica cretica]
MLRGTYCVLLEDFLAVNRGYQNGDEGRASQMTEPSRSWRGLQAPSRAKLCGMFYEESIMFRVKDGRRIRGLRAPSFEEVIKVTDKKELDIKEIPKQKSIRKLKSKPQWSWGSRLQHSEIP